MRSAVFLALGLVIASPAVGGPAPARDLPVAQAPRPLPAWLRAQIRISRTQWTNVTVTTGALPWTIEGCQARVRGSCRRTARIELTETDRIAYALRVQAVYEMPRCEPSGFAPNDPEFHLNLVENQRSGHLPRAWLDPAAAVSNEPCLADARLALWIHRRWSAPRPAP
jgi:hypothetical protein